MITPGHRPSKSDGVGRFSRNKAVHVWHGRVRDVPDPADTALLDDVELSTFEGLSPPFDGRYAGAHAAVRRILADHYLGGSPAAIRFGRFSCPRCADRTHGRPRIVTPATQLDFNLSRSGPYWLLAVTAGGQVGIDIEHHTGQDMGRAVEIALSDGELDFLRGTRNEREREQAFLRAWTRKEAILKATGVGIVADLRGLDVLTREGGPVRIENTEPGIQSSWMVEDIDLGPGLTAALARDCGLLGPVVLRQTEVLVVA